MKYYQKYKMKFGKFIAFLFLIYKNRFYLVKGQSINEDKNDCTNFYNYISGDFKYYDNKSCCSLSEIDCDYVGYITSFEREKIEIPNLINFPYLSNIKKLVIDNVGFKEIPDNIFKLKSLRILNFQYNQIEVIPPTIKNLTLLKELYLCNNKIRELPSEIYEIRLFLETLNLSSNNIEVIPEDIHLPNLVTLNLDNNNIKELPTKMFDILNLKELTLNNNNIDEVPPAIQKLTKLENLQLSNNNINKLPNEIFKLPNLKTFDLQNNPNLNLKMIKFDDLIIKDCFFHNITISCYEPQACKTVHLKDENSNDIIFNDIDIEKKYRKCTKEEINEILNIKENENDFSSLTIGGIIIGCIVIILVSFILIKKKRSKKNNKQEVLPNGNFRSESIKFLLRGKLNKNDNNDGNTSQSQIKPNKLNTNILIKSNSYHSPTLSVEPVFKNTQNNGNYVPLFKMIT